MHAHHGARSAATALSTAQLQGLQVLTATVAEVELLQQGWPCMVWQCLMQPQSQQSSRRPLSSVHPISPAGW